MAKSWSSIVGEAGERPSYRQFCSISLGEASNPKLLGSGGFAGVLNQFPSNEEWRRLHLKSVEI